MVFLERWQSGSVSDVTCRLLAGGLCDEPLLAIAHKAESGSIRKPTLITGLLVL